MPPELAGDGVMDRIARNRCFLDGFPAGPTRTRIPPCERTADTTVVQALHLMNSPNVHRKVTNDTGRAAVLATGQKSPAEIVDELYLLVYCRLAE